MPNPQQMKAVEKLNDLLAIELGSPMGPAAFAWKWSEDLTTLVQDIGLDGRPQMVGHCVCGVDVATHGPDCKMVIMKSKTKKILVAPNLFNRWVFCRWMEPPTEATWKAVFGSMEDYPRNGTYVPLTNNNTTLALKPELAPDDRLTRMMISTVHAARPVMEVLAEEQERREREEEMAQITRKGETISRPGNGTKWASLRDQIRDKMTTFGQVPGSRGATSFPSPQRVLKERTN